MISPEALRRYPYFAGLPDDTLRQVAMLGEERTFVRGEELFEESPALRPGATLDEKGDEAKHLMILTRGEVDLIYQLADGEEIVVGTQTAGDLIAISALIEPYQLTTRARARSDGALITLQAAQLRALCAEDARLGYLLMRQVARALRARLEDVRVQLAGMS